MALLTPREFYVLLGDWGLSVQFSDVLNAAPTFAACNRLAANSQRWAYATHWLENAIATAFHANYTPASNLHDFARKHVNTCLAVDAESLLYCSNARLLASAAQYCKIAMVALTAGRSSCLPPVSVLRFIVENELYSSELFTECYSDVTELYTRCRHELAVYFELYNHVEEFCAAMLEICEDSYWQSEDYASALPTLVNLVKTESLYLRAHAPGYVKARDILLAACTLPNRV